MLEVHVKDLKISFSSLIIVSKSILRMSACFAWCIVYIFLNLLIYFYFLLMDDARFAFDPEKKKLYFEPCSIDFLFYLSVGSFYGSPCNSIWIKQWTSSIYMIKFWLLYSAFFKILIFKIRKNKLNLHKFKYIYIYIDGRGMFLKIFSIK